MTYDHVASIPIRIISDYDWDTLIYRLQHRNPRAKEQIMAALYRRIVMLEDFAELIEALEHHDTVEVGPVDTKHFYDLREVMQHPPGISDVEEITLKEDTCSS